MTLGLESGSHGRPRLGCQVGGDLAVIREDEAGALVVLLDALGHGPEAHAVAVRAEAWLSCCRPDSEPAQVLTGLHAALAGSRGAAATVCRIDLASGRMSVGGLGNVALRVVGPGEGARYRSGRGGVLGERFHAPALEEHRLSPGQLVILHTDGVSDRFLEAPEEGAPGDGLLLGAARKVAQRIVFRHGKEHDDATCVVLRVQG